MPRGGARPGAGRKKGSGVEKTREAALRLLGEDVTPLDYMVGVMHGTTPYDEIKFEAAKAAAPYMHARLAATTVTATISKSHEDMLDEIERVDDEVVVGMAH